MPAEDDDAKSASASFPGVVQAVRRGARRQDKVTDPLERALGYGQLIAAIGEQMEWLAAERDAALIEVLAQRPGLSHRKLSPDLAMSRQRLDQLARIARGGGRPRTE